MVKAAWWDKRALRVSEWVVTRDAAQTWTKLTYLTSLCCLVFESTLSSSSFSFWKCTVWVTICCKNNSYNKVSHTAHYKCISEILHLLQFSKYTSTILHEKILFFFIQSVILFKSISKSIVCLRKGEKFSYLARWIWLEIKTCFIHLSRLEGHKMLPDRDAWRARGTCGAGGGWPPTMRRPTLKSATESK